MNELIEKANLILVKAQEEIDSLGEKYSKEKEEAIWAKADKQTVSLEKDMEDFISKQSKEEEEKYKEEENTLKEKLANDDKIVYENELKEKEEREKKQYELNIEWMTADEIAKEYLAKDIKAYAKSLWLKYWGKEKDVAQRILDFINK